MLGQRTQRALSISRASVATRNGFAEAMAWEKATGHEHLSIWRSLAAIDSLRAASVSN